MNTKEVMYNQNEFGMNYKVFYPDDYNDLPLIVYLHGAGERGTDISHIHRHGLPKMLSSGVQIPAVVLCPQCPAYFVWDNVAESLKEIIDAVAKEYKIKNDRILLTGSSMGGFGTWMMALTYPTFFAAIAPIAGGGMSWRASKLKTTPIYVMHGTKDLTVPPVYSKLMADAAKEAGADVKLLELDGYGHNDGIDYAYEQTDLIDWLLAQRRTNFDYVPEICEAMF